MVDVVKKIFIFLIIVVIVMPIIGSKMMENKLEKRLQMLEFNGVYVENSSADFNYLKTKKNYKFVVKDKDKFVVFLQRFSENKFKPYIYDLVDGVEIGVDVKYSNIPFIDVINLDIYPLKLSNKFMTKVDKQNPKFSKFIENFFQTKSLLYHINYDLLSSLFNGYIKDINEKYILENGKEIIFNLKGSKFNGHISSKKIDKIDSKTKELSLYIVDPNEKIELICKNLESSAKINSSNNYSYFAELESFSFKINDINKVDINKLFVNISSDIEQNKVQLSNKISFDKFKISNHKKDIILDSLNYNLFVKNIDKDNYEKLYTLLGESKYLQSKKINDKIAKIIMKILAKGVTVNLVDFSIKNIDYFEQKSLKGFSFKNDLVLKENANLVKNIKYDNNFFIKEVELESSLEISKKVFDILLKEFPLAIVAKFYAEESKENYIYNIKLKDGHLNVNDKLLR